MDLLEPSAPATTHTQDGDAMGAVWYDNTGFVMDSQFSRKFRNRFRPSRSVIKGLLEVYLPFIQPYLELEEKGAPSALDLGCGRGEWLEILSEAGFSGSGVDLDGYAVELCRELGYEAERDDALSRLEVQPPDSLQLITGFHVAEHLPFEQLTRLICESHRVLAPGGMLILETPNPENLYESSVIFNIDPEHVKPIPHMFLSFLAESAGFSRVKTVRLQEDKKIFERSRPSLRDVLLGVSRNYAIVAQKEAPEWYFSRFPAFAREYGISLEEMVCRYDNYSVRELRQFKAEIRRLNADLRRVYESTSWRITAPLRGLADLMKSFIRKSD